MRNPERGEETAAAVRADHPGAAVDVAACDVSSLADVRRYAAEVRDREAAVHGLVHNAGVMPPERTETAEGHETALATHVLGPFLLTRELRPVLRAGASPTAPSRVVFVSSGGMYTAALHIDDPEFRQGTYSGGAAYARTKRMQVVLAELLADDLAGDGDGRAQHAPGLGRHPRRRELHARLPPRHRSPAAHRGAGRRHRRVAAGGRRARAQHRGVLARPRAPPDALPAPRRGEPAGPRGALDALRGCDRSGA